MVCHRINVLGWYGHENCGDDSYNLSFSKAFPNTDFLFTDKIIKNYDGYILGGGDTVTDYFLDSFQKINAPKYIVSATIRQSLDFQKLRQFNAILVRDRDSEITIKSKGILNCHYCQDLGFMLQGNRESGEKLLTEIYKEEGCDLYQKRIGVIINSNLMPMFNATAYDQSRFENFCYSTASAFDQYPASFVFIPYGKQFPYDDRISNGFLASKCKFWKKNLIIMKKISVQETIDITSSLDAIISSRLHSSIFALSSGIPIIDIIHNHKNKKLLEDLGLKQYSLYYTGCNTRDLLNKIEEVLSSKDKIKQQINEIISREKQLILEVVKNVDILR